MKEQEIKTYLGMISLENNFHPASQERILSTSTIFYRKVKPIMASIISIARGYRITNVSEARLLRFSGVLKVVLI